MNGIINILKPAGMTSHDVVGVMRKIFGIKRIGHTGTLDPMAVGVLPICIGSATRIIEYLDPDYKKYRCEMVLGIRTDTEDIWGKVLEKQHVCFVDDSSAGDIRCNGSDCKVVTTSDIFNVIKDFVGDVVQTPPDYSAVRIAGRRLYDYARNGEKVQAAPRRIHVKSLEIISMDHKAGKILFDIESSKGSYIRTICTEMGRKLGCGAAMSFLVRTASGSFLIENAFSLEEVEAAVLNNDLGLVLLPMDYPLGRLASLHVRDPQRAAAFVNGGPLDVQEVEAQTIELDRIYRVYYLDQFIAIARYNEETGKIKAEKVFCRALQTAPDC
jgi:tRNA pseudouridine55 synthase